VLCLSKWCEKVFGTMADFEGKLDSFDLRKEIEAIDPR
jgi:hypothetical protein